MPTFKLNDQEIEFQPGDTVIRAAWRKGIEIPHYCWHPGLSVAANCRMCLVEIKQARPMMLPILKWDAAKGEYVEATKPKLQPACQQAVSEGMEVYSQSPEVVQAQQSVQEFLLLNHPVDCPICDQAGECKLQDYWLQHQHKLKRKETEPVHKSKGVRFGPTIVYDGERCVMCTRCVRFNEEIVKDPVLDMRERGNVNEIALSPGRQLDHDYSLMNEHVCPVGALTSRDFRFKARVWFLKSAPSVCTGCATGCNSFVDFDPRNQTVYRLRPRDNEAVNQYWMCDAGMMSYKRYHEARVTRGRDGTRLVRIEDAVAAAAKLLSGDRSKLGVVLSAQHSNEDNFVLGKLATALGAAKLYLGALPDWKGDSILRSTDANPNRKGAQLAAGSATLATTADLAKDVESGAITLVLALGFASVESADALASLKSAKVVSLTTHEGALPSVATVVVPVAAHHETSGSFTNGKGVVQAFKKAVQPQHGVKPAWETLLDLGRALGVSVGLSKLGEVQKAMLPAASTTGAQA